MATLYHVGLTVRDLERSMWFYREIAGMHQVEWHEFQSPRFDQLTNNPGAALKSATMTAGDFSLQLLEYVASGGPAIAPHHNSAGSPHISFFVQDAAAKYRQLTERADVTITSALVEIKPGRHSFYVTDPDGVPVEFVEPPRA